MTSIVSHIVVVLVYRELGDGYVNWPLSQEALLPIIPSNGTVMLRNRQFLNTLHDTNSFSMAWKRNTQRKVLRKIETCEYGQ